MDDKQKPKEQQISTQPKVFDVARPGKSVPSATARPLIMTRQTVARDPMVAKTQHADVPVMNELTKREAYLAAPDSSPGGQTVTYPEQLQDSEVQKSDGIAKDSLADAQPKREGGVKVIEVPSAEKPKDTDTPAKAFKIGANDPEKAEQTPPTVHNDARSTVESEDELDEIDEFAGRAALKQAKKVEEDEEIVRMASAQALADSKQYVVPVHTQNSSKVWLWVFVGLLFAAGAALAYLYYTFM